VKIKIAVFINETSPIFKVVHRNVWNFFSETGMFCITLKDKLRLI